jgi:hypothetical protein
MSTRIQINEAMLLDYYEQLMDEVYLLYHHHQTNIPHLSISDAELAEMSEYDAMGRSLAAASMDNQRIKSTKVIFFRRPRSTANLPRR